MGRLSATEAARNFSAVLNRVAAGEEVEIIRNGATVALLVPPRARLITAERMLDLLASAPPVDSDFADDVRSIRAEAGPAEVSWRS